jgi:diguanylate cyclase (GGDEF)-like protein
MKHLADELRRSASTDSLTGIANRRQFDEWLQREWLRSRRHGYPISLLLIDIDHFKLYNDRYGHPKGDVCLRQVARAIDQTARRTADLVARCGGEEFGVLLPHTGRLGAEYMANRMLREVEALGIGHSASATNSHVSVSIGIGCYDDASACWVRGGGDPGFGSDSAVPLSEADLLLAADKALYSAKRAGRAQFSLLDIDDAASSEPKESSSQILRALRGVA